MGRTAWFALLGGIVLGTGAWFAYNWLYPPKTTLVVKSSSGEALPEQTEVLFQRYLDPSGTVIDEDEWRSARTDHRVIAYLVAHCKHLTNMDTMSLETFSTLLLDLTPAGTHLFNTRDSSGSLQPVGNKDAQTIELAPEDIALVSLSDMIERTRMHAAANASNNVPYLRWLGIITLVVSAFATLFITLQSRIRPLVCRL